MAAAFGNLLKGWRTRRRFSQLQLALEANVSSRHLSFIETGRAQPSRSMVLQLAQAMDVPRSERNLLLQAAGFAGVYSARALEADEMRPVREALTWTLARHDPYPGLVLDRHWCVLMANECATRLLGPIGIGIGDSILEAFVADGPLREALVNGPAIARHMIARLRNESSHVGGDAVLDAAQARLRAAIDDEPEEAHANMPAVIPVVLSMDGRHWSFFSTIAQFSSSEDIVLADLKLELMFPADEATRAALLG